MASLTLSRGEIVERVDFTFATSSPLTLYNLLAGDDIVEVKLVIETAFDDVASSVQIGTVATPGLVFAANESNISKPDCQWLSSRVHEIASSETLRLLISPGTSTQGTGFVLFRIRRP